MYPPDYRTGDEFDCEDDAKAYEYEDDDGNTVFCPLRGTDEERDEFFRNKERRL